MDNIDVVHAPKPHAVSFYDRDMHEQRTAFVCAEVAEYADSLVECVTIMRDDVKYRNYLGKLQRLIDTYESERKKFQEYVENRNKEDDKIDAVGWAIIIGFILFCVVMFLVIINYWIFPFFLIGVLFIPGFLKACGGS